MLPLPAVDFLTLLLIAVGLAMDASAVAMAVGAAAREMTFRPTFRLAWHFGLFQFLMPILGWAGGVSVQRHVEAYDHWVAFGLLAFVGVRMIRASRDSNAASRNGDPTRGLSLVMLSTATSIDALAVGLSLAALRIGILYPSAVIGLVAASLTTLGIWLGARLGDALGKRMELIGGFILIGIGIRILIQHLT
jgi:putative Mn2+ efflux pump MntP